MKINEYKKLLNQADVETSCILSCHQMMAMPSIKKILETGEIGIPFILQHYKEKRSILWGLALAIITDINLIDEGYFKKQDQGKVDKLQKAWLKWGKDNGYILR